MKADQPRPGGDDHDPSPPAGLHAGIDGRNHMNRAVQVCVDMASELRPRQSIEGRGRYHARGGHQNIAGADIRFDGRECRLHCGVVGDVEASAIQAHLAASLPPYMVPGQLVRLQALPLSANGKVDRRALPDPVGALAAASSRPATPPRSAAEAALASLWSDVLRVPVTDVHSDFL